MKKVHKLNATTSDRIHRQLWTLIADLRHPDDVAVVLTALLSKNEAISLAKRVEIVRLLQRGVSYEEIQDKLNVSSATVSRLVRGLQDSQPTTNRYPAPDLIKRKLELEAWADWFISKLRKIWSFR